MSLAEPLELLPYQRDAVQFLHAAPRRLLLLEQGLGKTPTSIAACNDDERVERVLVVCPAIGRTMWRRQIMRWRKRAWQAMVVSYDYFSRRGDVDWNFDTLIADEGHYLRSPSSMRTRQVYGRGGCVDRAVRSWVLSGTLTPNGPHEIYTHLRGLFPQYITHNGVVRSYEQFLNDFFHWKVGFAGRMIVERPKIGAIPYLRRIASEVAFRKLAIEVLRDLPPLRIDHESLTAAQDEADEDFALVGDVPGDLDAEVPEEVPFATESRLAGLDLAPAAAQYIANELMGGRRKIVVFFHHHDVRVTLRSHLSHYPSVVVDGSQNDKKRQEAIDAFQSDPKVRLFFGQVQACGTTIDLFSADRLIFAEASWVPEENAQAIKRVHRIGQTRPCRATFLSLAGSIHEARTRVLARKTRNIAMLWQTGESQ